MEEGGAGAETSGAVDGTDPNIRGDEDEIMSEEILVCSLFIFFPNIVFQNLIAVYQINSMTQWFYTLYWVVYFVGIYKLQDDTPAIPDDFYYNLEEHVSKPAVTEDSGLPADLLTLEYSILIYIAIEYDYRKKLRALFVN